MTRVTDEVERLVAALRVRMRLRECAQSFLGAAMPCAVLWLLARLLGEPYRTWSLVLWLWPLAAALQPWLRQAPGTIATIDRRLRLQDGLRTLVAGFQLSAAAPSYVACLRDQLNRALLSSNPRRALPRRGTSRLRWWLVPLIFLLLLQLGLPDFVGSAGPSGFGGSSGPGSAQGPGDGPGQGTGDRQAHAPNDAGERPQQPPPQQDRPEPSAPHREPPEVAKGQEQPPGPLPEPETIKDAFVPPLYDRPGETREQEVAAIEVPEGGGAGAGGSGSRGPPPEALPQPSTQELLRAAEEALARRRVEGGEAAFVRRYFQALANPSTPANRR